MPSVKCRARGPIARLLAADQQGSIIINGQQSRRGSRVSEALFDLRRQFREGLRAGPGLGGRRRMSGIKKNSKLGFTARSDPPASDDRRGSPSLFGLLETRHSLLLISMWAGAGVGAGSRTSNLDLDKVLDMDLDLGLLVKRQAPEICEVGGITRTVPSQHACGPATQWCVCSELAGWLLGKCSNKKNPGCLGRRWGRSGSLGLWSPQGTSIAEELAMIKMEKRIPLDPKLSILDTERERERGRERPGRLT